MRNVALLFALVAVAFVAVRGGMDLAERKAAADLMNISEMQTIAYKNMPTTAVKDPF